MVSEILVVAHRLILELFWNGSWFLDLSGRSRAILLHRGSLGSRSRLCLLFLFGSWGRRGCLFRGRCRGCSLLGRFSMVWSSSLMGSFVVHSRLDVSSSVVYRLVMRVH